MRKTLALLGIAIFILATLAGCSKKTNESLPPPPEPQKTELPELAQNKIYMTNRISAAEPKDLSFKEVSDDKPAPGKKPAPAPAEVSAVHGD